MAKESTKPKSATSEEEPLSPTLKLATTSENDEPSDQPGNIGVRSPLFSHGTPNKHESPKLRALRESPPQTAQPNNSAQASASSPGLPPKRTASPGTSGTLGLEDPLLATRETKEFVPIQHVMFDNSRQTLKKALSIFLILGLLSFVSAIGFLPGFGAKVRNAAESAKTWVAPLTSKLKLKSLTRNEALKAPGSAVKSGQVEQGLTRWQRSQNTANLSCYELISGFTSYPKPSLAHRIDTAECYLQRLDAQNALKVLSPLTGEIQKISESALNRMSAEHSLADAYHLMVMARIQSNRFQEATELTKNHCSRWKPSNTCVTKLSLYAAHNLTLPAAVDELFKIQSDLGAKAQSRLWLASALHSQKQGSMTTALRRYDLALKSAPRRGALLRREIYESYSFFLYKIGSFDKMRTVASRGVADLRFLETQGLAKLRFFSQLGLDLDQPRFIRLTLGRSEIKVAARNDLRLVHVLGIESLKLGLTKELQRFLTDTWDFYSAQDEGYSNEKRAIATWSIRLLLFKGENQLALQKLTELAALRDLDATERHLRGVAYAHDSSVPRMQSLAADNFAIARSLRNQPESDLALGFALLRSGKTGDTADVIKRLDTKITQGNLKFWLEMLKAEWNLVTGRLENAEKICRLWAKNKPSFQTPVKLQIEILTRMGNTPGAQSLREDLDEPSMAQHWPQNEESLSSPLGPLSLADRSI